MFNMCGTILTFALAECDWTCGKGNVKKGEILAETWLGNIYKKYTGNNQKIVRNRKPIPLTNILGPRNLDGTYAWFNTTPAESSV